MNFNKASIFDEIEGERINKTLETINKFKIDSREIEENDVFIAIKGEKNDGHDFVSDAISRGAKGVVVERYVEVPENIFEFVVKDTKEFIRSLGTIGRSRIKGSVIGITGSAGKTTLKEAISLALSKKFSVLKPQGNLNTDLSLPLFLFNEVTSTEDFIVLEMGIQKPNDMDTLLKFVKPHYGIITNIGESHIEYLHSKEGVLKEKFKLVEFVDKDGFSFLNGDDDLLFSSSQRLKNKLLVGFLDRNNIKISSNVRSNIMDINLLYEGRKFSFSLPYVGKQFAYTASLTFAVSFFFGVDPDYIVSALKEFKPYKGRYEVIKLGRVTIIDDTYNSNPVSLRVALENLKAYKEPKVVILGDMLELGTESLNIHRSFGSLIDEVNPYLLVTYGNFSKVIFESTSLKSKFHFENSSELQEFLNTFDFKEDSVILIKGSRGMKMEAFVEVLKGRFKDDLQ